MEVWNTFQQQIATLWRQWSVQQRVGISAAAVACLAAVIGTLIWATQPEYVVLVNASSSHEAASIIGKLDAAQIGYDLNYSGTVISVSRGDVGEARLAVRDELEPMGLEETPSSGMFPDGADAENDRRQRVLEKRIAQTIEKIKGVRSAIVHLSRPDYSPFVMEQSAPEASIMIVPASRGSLTNRVAHSVILLVARSVEGLDPANINLTDTDGRPYSMSEGMTGDMSGRYEYQQRLELSLAHNAQSILDRMLGDGKSEVRVTADIDFREVSRKETTYDPDGKIKVTENVETVSSEGGVGAAGGVAGLDLNHQADVPGNAKAGKYKSETSTVNYDTSMVVSETRDNPGTIKRLTIAAIVDLSSASGGEITVDSIKAIIQRAVGFDDLGRDDKIEVLEAALALPEVPVEEPGLMPLYEQYKPIAEAILVGLGATIAFFIAVLALRKLRPVIVKDDNAPGFNREDYERMAELSQKARANPEVAARILATWLGQEDQNETPETEVPRKSRAA